MKKEVVVIGFVLLLIFVSCSKISIQKTVYLNQSEAENLSIKKLANDTTKIALGCRGDECHQYCQQHQEECKEFCEQNPNKCPIDTTFIEKVGRVGPDFCMKNPKECLNLCEKLPGICPKEMKEGLGFFEVEGPKGCKGPECQQYCQQNMKECQDWCSENPDKLFCKLLSGEVMPMPVGGFPGATEEVVEPPQTIISFAKSVSFHDNAFTKEDITKAKELGINMVTIWPARFIKNNEITFSPERLGLFINFAHKNGLQVELRSSFGGEPINNYEKFKSNALKHVADFAKFAERYRVYRIVPFGEIDNDMLNYCSKITEFSKELLTEMRKYYSGQIGVGVVGSWRDCGYNFKGYNYLTFSAYPQRSRGIDPWLKPNLNVPADTDEAKNLAFLTKWAREVADRSNISILHIGETGVVNPDDFKRADASSYAEGGKEKEAEYYRELFEQVSGKINGISVFYNSLSNYFSIYGDPAEKVIKEWYNKLYPEEKSQQQSGIPSCNDKKELFTVSHIPISELQNIVPLGNLNPSGHTFPTNHLYFHLKGFSGDESSSNAPVVAPGNIWVTRIGSSEYTMKGRQIKDYKLDFRVCTEVRGYFIHLTSLSEKLLQSFAQPENCKEYDTGSIHYKNCEKDFYFSPISVAVGEPIGTAGGSSDFGLADLRTQELVYANPKRWYEDPLHRVCPLDYFTANIGVQLKSMLGSSDSKRTVEPVCGEVAQDKPGTAQGVWFVKGTSNTYPEDPHLALVHDNIDPLKGVFSVGTSINGLSSGTYSFNPANSGLVNRDFKDITADGKVYCYEAAGGRPYTQYVVVILQLTSSTTLRIEKQNLNKCGNGPWTFSSNYVDFER